MPADAKHAFGRAACCTGNVRAWLGCWGPRSKQASSAACLYFPVLVSADFPDRVAIGSFHNVDALVFLDIYLFARRGAQHKGFGPGPHKRRESAEPAAPTKGAKSAGAVPRRTIGGGVLVTSTRPRGSSCPCAHPDPTCWHSACSRAERQQRTGDGETHSEQSCAPVDALLHRCSTRKLVAAATAAAAAAMG